jgi:hypothetical protein
VLQGGGDTGSKAAALCSCPKLEERWPVGPVLGHKAGWGGCCTVNIKGNLGGLYCGLGRKQ